MSAYLEDIKCRITFIVITVGYDFHKKGINPSIAELVTACKKTTEFSELLFDVPNLVFEVDNETDQLMIHVPKLVLH